MCMPENPMNPVRAARGRRSLAAWIAGEGNHPANAELYFSALDLTERRLARVLTDFLHFLESAGIQRPDLVRVAAKADVLYDQERGRDD